MKIPRTVISSREPENKEVLWVKPLDNTHYTMLLFDKSGWITVAADTKTVEDLKASVDKIYAQIADIPAQFDNFRIEIDSFKEEVDTTKQDKLVSGQNIKTIKGNDITGSGDLAIDTGVMNIEWDSSQSPLYNVKCYKEGDEEGTVIFQMYQGRSNSIILSKAAIGVNAASKAFDSIEKTQNQLLSTLDSLKDTSKTYDANTVLYSNKNTSLEAINVQSAIDELFNRVIVMSEEEYDDLAIKDDKKIYMLFEE